MLPTVAALAEQYQVGRGTVSRALRRIADNGLHVRAVALSTPNAVCAPLCAPLSSWPRCPLVTLPASWWPLAAADVSRPISAEMSRNVVYLHGYH